MTRDEMMDAVIRHNGFENKWTIWFCELCANHNLTEKALKNFMVYATTMADAETEADE